MAIPSYKSKGTGALSNGDPCTGITQIDATAPATVDAGDVLIFATRCRCNAGTNDSWTPPTGWTLINNAATGAVLGYAAFYKVADGTEDGATISASQTFTGASSVATAQIWSYTGSGTGGVVPSAGTVTIGSSAAATMSAVTTTVTNSLAFCIVIVAGSVTIAASTGESGGDWVQSVAEETVSATASYGPQQANMASIGTITSGTATLGSAASWCTISCEIKEVSGTVVPRALLTINQAVTRAASW